MEEWKQWGAAVAGLLLLCSFILKHWAGDSTAGWKSRKSKKPLPPGPTSWPFSWPVVGFIPSVGQFVHKDLGKVADTYGPIAYFKLGSIPAVVVSSADAARELLTIKDQEFVDKSEGAAMHQILAKCKGIAFGKYDEQAVVLRKICATEIMTRARIKSYETTRREDGKVMIESIYKAAAENPIVDVRKRLAAYSANTTTQILFRRRFHGAVVREESQHINPCADGPVDFKQMVSLVSSVIEMFGAFNVADFIPSLKWFDPQGLKKKGKLVGIQYDNMLAEIVREHREFHQNNAELISSDDHVKDFVDVLLLEQKQTNRITDASIKGAISDVLLGGIGSPLATVEWVLALLIRYPQYLDRAHEEMDRVVGRHRLVEDADLPNMPFLRAVLKEAVRYLPPYPYTARVNGAEAELGGFRIPKNSLIFLHLEKLGHDPAVWKDPLQFNPDRFMESGNVDFTPKHDQFNLIPFGTGRRGCPGKPLGLATITFAVALLVQAFHWEPAPGLTAQDINMDELPGATRFRAHPLLPAVTPRLPPHLYSSGM